MRSGWNHNIQYHDLILQSIAAPCRRGLDVGCGEGVFTRRLAAHCGSVVGIDLDPSVLTAASTHAESPLNATFVQGDIMTYPFPESSFDLVVAVATIHHLPLGPALMRLKSLVAPGGALAVIGLYRAASLTDHLFAAAALPASHVLRIVRPWEPMNAPVQQPQESLAELRAAANALLPGMLFKRRLFFRYSLLWRKLRSPP